MLTFLKKCGLLLLIFTMFVALFVFVLEPIFTRLSLNNKPVSVIFQKAPQKTAISEDIRNEKPLQSSISENEKSTDNADEKLIDKVVSIQEGSNNRPTPIQTTIQNHEEDTKPFQEDTKPLMKRPPKEGMTKAVVLEKRVEEIESEMEALAPHTGKGNHAITLRLLDLEEEKFTILQEQGLLHTHDGVNPFNEIKIMRFVFSSLTNGKVPVSIGEQIASYLEEDGQYEAAAIYRTATRRAIENGDDFYKLEHLEDK